MPAADCPCRLLVHTTHVTELIVGWNLRVLDDMQAELLMQALTEWRNWPVSGVVQIRETFSHFQARKANKFLALHHARRRPTQR